MKKEINTSTIYRANAKSIATQLVKIQNGLGQSKVKAKHESGLKGQNGHLKSDLVHSAKYMDNFKSVSQGYFQHIKDSIGGKIESSINAETLKDFLLVKLAKEEINGGSANTYLSILEKMSEGLTKLTNKVYITKDEFKQIRSNLKQEYNLQSTNRNRAYLNPEKIVKEMEKFSEYSISSKLQLEIGLRRDDAINSSKWELQKDGTMIIKGSKNGMSYQSAPISKKLREEVKEAIKNGYKVSETSYSNDLKEAVKSSQEIWDKKGSHGLRYNFAQDRLKELVANGITYNQAKAQVSLEMGHSRLSITDTYTNF